MGVLTTAYSIRPEQLAKIKKDIKYVGFVLGLRTSEDSAWKLESYNFGKSISSTFQILKQCGYQHTGNLIDSENFLRRKNYRDYEGYAIWFFDDRYAADNAVDELHDATFEKLKKDGLANEVFDYYGNPIPENEYEYYVGDIENLKKFLSKVSEDRNYLLFAEV